MDADEVEKRLTELIDKFETKKSVEARADMSNDQRELMEKSQAVYTKLSAMLSSRIGIQDDADVKKLSEQSSLESLPALLSLVLEKLEKTTLDDGTKIGKSDSIAPENEQGAQPVILCDDPEYAKYFKMLKLGLQRTAVTQALERDGKDISVLDMDPNRSYEEQRTEEGEQLKADKNADLKALFAKRATTMKDSNKNAALEALFAKRSATMHHEDISPILKDDPEFQKYMRMLKIGMPKEKVRQALERDGKDQAVADMDPDKPYSSQVKSADSQPPLSDDEEYAKFFKVSYLIHHVNLLLYILCCLTSLVLHTINFEDAQGAPLLFFAQHFTSIQCLTVLSTLISRWVYPSAQCGKRCKKKAKIQILSTWTHRKRMLLRLMVLELMTR